MTAKLETAPRPGLRMLDGAYRLFATWRFPAFVLALLVFYNLMMLGFLLVPVTDTPFGRFAEDFKTWCLGYDPATGKFDRTWATLMLTEPIALAGVLSLVWSAQLRELWRAPRQALPWVAGAFVLVAAGAGAFGLIDRTPIQGPLPFPAERLRTAQIPPSFELVDQDGRPATLSDHAGKVVVLTGVYASCGYTCPMIMAQNKRALASLPEAQRADVTVLAITLDPEKDTPAQLSGMAKAQGVSSPAFRLLGGPADEVNAILDRLDITRVKDPKTGIINHVNVFIVLDRQGRIAYRFSLGERQEQWLSQALRLLVAETPGVG